MNILDPRARDRFIRAYAYLEAEFARGARSAVDCLLPFLNQAAAKFHGKPFSEAEIAEFVSTTYRVEIPLYMFDSLVRAMRDSGALRYEERTEVLFCDRAGIRTDQESGQLNLADRDVEHLEDSLGRLGSELGIETPSVASSWGEALINFLQGYVPADQRPTTVKGVIAKDVIHFDNWVVSEFVRREYVNQTGLFATIRRLYYGVLIGEFLTNLQSAKSAEDFSALNVVYDTTVLLRLLGTSGELLRVATQQLHDALHALGCQTYYFPHIFAEAHEILESVVGSLNSREYERMYAETREALVSTEVTANYLRMLPGELDIRLSKLGVFEFPEISNEPKPDALIDEKSFERALGESRGRSDSRRDQRDAQSLGLIMRLRNANHATSLAKAGHVLVTHNKEFMKLARSFVRASSNVRAFHIPPVLDLPTITTATFFAYGADVSQPRIDTQLASACYTARLPSPEWEAEFWREMDQLEQSSEEARELLQNHYVTQSLRDALRRESFGNPTLLKRVNLPEKLREAQERAEADSARKREEGVTQGMRRGQEATLDQLETRVAHDVQCAVRAVLVVIGLALALLAFVPEWIGVFWTGMPVWLANVARGFAGLLSAVTVLSAVGLMPEVTRVNRVPELVGRQVGRWARQYFGPRR